MDCRALVWVEQPRAQAIPRSKAGQEYRRLTAKIESLQAEISAWEQCLSTVQGHARQELLPLQERYGEELLALFAVLEEQLQDRRLRWGKVQRMQAWESLSWFAEQAQVLLVGTAQAAALEAFWQRCQEEIGMPEGEEEDPEEEALFQALSESLGIPEDLIRAAVSEGKTSVKNNAPPVGEEAATESGPQEPDWEAFFQQAGARRAEAERKKEQKAAAELRNHTLLRSWYRRLVSLLHPDREQDPAERQRKTRQLQEVHRAYQNGDAWQILQHAEALGMATEAFAGEEILKGLNQGLRKQQRRLQEQLQQMQWEIRQRFDLPPFGKIQPETLEAHYRQDVQQWQERIQTTREERMQLAAAPKETKSWLRELRRQHQAWLREQQWW